MINQKHKVLEYLQSGKILTRKIAMQSMGVMNVTARIAELRNDGYIIEPNITKGVNRYGDKVRYAAWTLEGVSEPSQMELSL